MKKLIINADDFGLSEGINNGIIDCYKKGVVKGIFDAFYIFTADAVDMNWFEEDVVEWYDIYWLLDMMCAGYEPVTSKKVTVMHFCAQTMKNKSGYKKKVKQEIIDRYGTWGLKHARRNPRAIRKAFLNHDE